MARLARTCSLASAAGKRHWSQVRGDGRGRTAAPSPDPHPVGLTLALRLLEFRDQRLQVSQPPYVGVYLRLLGHGRSGRGSSGDRQESAADEARRACENLTGPHWARADQGRLQVRLPASGPAVICCCSWDEVRYEDLVRDGRENLRRRSLRNNCAIEEEVVPPSPQQVGKVFRLIPGFRRKPHLAPPQRAGRGRQRRGRL